MSSSRPFRLFFSVHQFLWFSELLRNGSRRHRLLQKTSHLDRAIMSWHWVALGVQTREVWVCSHFVLWHYWAGGIDIFHTSNAGCWCGTCTSQNKSWGDVIWRATHLLVWSERFHCLALYFHLLSFIDGCCCCCCGGDHRLSASRQWPEKSRSQWPRSVALAKRRRMFPFWATNSSKKTMRILSLSSVWWWF